MGIKHNKLCPFKCAKVLSSYRINCNWHKNIELMLVVDGIGQIQYGGELLNIQTNDIIIINSGVLHRPSDLNGLKFHFIIIDEGFFLENGLPFDDIHFCERFQDETTKALFLDAEDKIRVHKQEPDRLSTAKARASVLALLIDIIERHAAKKDGRKVIASPSEEYVKRVIEQLNTSYSQPISLDDLAAKCGITKFHLAREFKRLTGQTVLTYANLIRCRNAEILIGDGKSVTEAALECGFESQSYFSRTYKRLMGSSPSKNKKTRLA